MREIFTSGSAGRALGNRCFYQEADLVNSAADLVVPGGCAAGNRGAAYIENLARRYAPDKIMVGNIVKVFEGRGIYILR